METRKFQINEIARIFRVPPHMVGDLEKSSFSNIEQQSLEFVKYTLEPWLVRWEQSIQRDVAFPGGKEELFCQVQCGGAAPGRLCQQDDRLRHRKAERLDERQRHP